MPKTTLGGLLPQELKKDLTQAEKTLLDKARKGKPADFTTGDKETDKPDNADNWGDDRRIRADLLYWLCVDREASQRVHAKGVQIYGAKVEGGLDFEGVTLPHPLWVIDCAIPEGIILQDAQARTIALSGSHTGPISADRLTTQGYVFLRNAKVRGQVWLLGANIDANLECDGATFENPEGEALSAQNLSVKGGLVWRSMEKRPVGVISLLHAKVGPLVDDAASWPHSGNLQLEGFEYEAFVGGLPQTATERLRWLALQPEKPFHPQPYEQLAKVFRQTGREVEARKVLIAKQDALRKHGELGRLSKAWNWFLGISIAHGYEPWRVMVFMVVMIMIGWGVFWGADANGAMIATKSNVPNPFNAFVYSLEVFVPLVDLHQESYWLPDAKATYGWLLRLYFWVHIALGWISSTLLVAALTGLVRKE